MKFQRIYRPVNEWEEVRFNMWGAVEDRAKAIQTAIEFTGNDRLYGSYMQRVIREWPVSCENALTDYFLNRRAWLGHAAVALALQLPEDITRAAWAHLTNEQQLLANEEAKRAISCWETAHAKSLGICQNVGEQMLLGGDTGGGSVAAFA